MKTAIYIEDGTVQLVITPESEFEKNSLSTFLDKPLNAKLYAGSFYDCRGGWVMQTAYRCRGPYDYNDNHKDSSLILVAREASTEPVPANPMIAGALARNEDTTGLCTVREFAASIMENPVYGEYSARGFVPPSSPDSKGVPWGEMAFTHNGRKYVVEMVVTQCENVPTTTPGDQS